MKNKYFYNFYLLRTKKSVNDIRYVGVTTKSLNERFATHKHEALVRNSSRPVYNWWRKRILEGFEIIIEPIECNFSGDWEFQEQYWIRHYKQMGFKLLNVSDGGNGVVTVKQRSIDSRTRSIQAHNKSVIALTKDGKFFKEFESCTQAAKYFNTSPTSITNACKNKWSKSSNNYIWVFKSEYDLNKNYIYEEKIGILCYKFDLNGNLISTFESLDKCARCEHIDERRIIKAINSKTTINEFIYAKFPKINVNEYTIEYIHKIEEYDKYGNLIAKYKSYRDFCIKNNLNYNTVYPHLKLKNFVYKNTLKIL